MPRLEIRPKGINYDLPPEQVGPEEWTFGQNIRIEDDKTVSSLGNTRVFGTPLQRPIWGASMPLSSGQRFLYGSSGALSGSDGTNHANITPAAGFGATEQRKFTGGMFNGLFVANEPGHQPCYWDGVLANIALPLTGWTAGDRAASLRPFKYYLVAIGGIIAAVDAPYIVRWSVAAAPGTIPSSWTPSATNDAGSVPLAGAREILIDAAPVRDALAVFENHATWVMNYVGGQFVFANRRVLSTVGLLSPNAWGTIGADLLFLADGDLVLFDGQSVKSVLRRRMARALFSGMASSAVSQCFVVVQPSRQLAMVGFPTGTATYCNRALLWDYAGDNFGIIDLPDYAHAFAGAVPVGSDAWDSAVGTFDSDATTWDALLASDNYIINCRPLYSTSGSFEANIISETPSDGAIEVIARKEKMPLGDASRLKQVTRLYPKTSAPTGTQLFFRVGVSKEAAHPVSWSAEQSYIVGQDQKVDCRATGRYVSVQVRSLTVRQWSISGFDLEYQDAGAR